MHRNKKRILYIATAHADYWRVKSFSSFIKQLYPNSVILTSNKNTYLLRYLEIFLKLLPHFILINKKFDILFLGYMSQITTPFLKIFWKGPIINDFFISLYDTIVLDRNKVNKNSLFAKFMLFLDRYSIIKSDSIIVETQELPKYFKELLKIKQNKKYFPVNIGANDNIFKPTTPLEFNKKLTITFHGTFIPLQGIETIIEAAKILENRNMNFQINLIGYGQTYDECKKLAESLKLSSVFFLGFLNIKKIINIYKESHIGLGIFGTSDKAKRVISNKAYEIISLQRLLITGNTLASNKFFSNMKDSILVKPGSPKDLAAAIIHVYNNPSLINKISKKAYKKYQNFASSKKIKQDIKNIIESF